MLIKDLILTYLLSPLTYYFSPSTSTLSTNYFSPLPLPLSFPPSISTIPSTPCCPGFYNPLLNFGSLLNRVTPTLGEPLNLIISNLSTPDILGEHGFISYTRSLGFWNECAKIHIGESQFSNLGDGKGWQGEMNEMRESFKFPYIGSCIESFIGGNHFRSYKQNGSEANSGAWFLSVSLEVDIRGHHTISPNGYNLGRDKLISKALKGTRYKRRIYTTTVEWVEGLLIPGSEGINHDIEQDGRIAVLTVREY